MSSCTPLDGSMGWKLFSYLEKYPTNYDVTFSVGPEKKIVNALKIILRSSSPVFEMEFKDRWDQAVLKEGEGIPLPDLDPVAFELFIKLMILDTWSVDALKALKLPSNRLLHLMSICRKYDMTAAFENLTELLKELLKNFESYVETDGFLLLSQSQLEMILASDELPINEVQVYTHACSWAKEQCKKQSLEVTGKNMRLVLGGCLYQIRFPIMTIPEFVNVTLNNGFLQPDESVKIFQLIGADEKRRNQVDATELRFKMEKRNAFSITSVPTGCFTISLAQLFPAIDTPFVCDGSQKYNSFNIKMKITLRGLGFLGPIDEDSFFDVTVHIKKYSDYKWEAYTEEMEKRIFAHKSKTFYFIFDQPIVLDPIPYDGLYNFYGFHFSLKGPPTRSLQTKGDIKTIYDDNREFVIYWNYPQLVEVLYDTL